MMDDHQIRNGYASLKIFANHYFAIYSSHSFIILNCLTFLFPFALEINVIIIWSWLHLLFFDIIRNGEHWSPLTQNKTPGLYCKNMEAMPGETEGAGGSPAPFIWTLSMFKFTCSRNNATAIVNLTTNLGLSLIYSQKSCLSFQSPPLY